jgi:hypothetical protein
VESSAAQKHSFIRARMRFVDSGVFNSVHISSMGLFDCCACTPVESAVNVGLSERSKSSIRYHFIVQKI